jgi:hypothetical protein
VSEPQEDLGWAPDDVETLQTLFDEDLDRDYRRNGSAASVALKDEVLSHGPRTLPGGDWILDAPTETPAVWGDPSGRVAWAEGEPLLIVGPEGVGKTTIAQQLVLARIGLRPALFRNARPG